VDSIYAYPMGRLRRSLKLTPLGATESAELRKWLRVALAAETSGLLHAAIASTVEHLSLRKQFGRPLGAFQALRHRMAECTVLAGGVRWLALKAAATRRWPRCTRRTAPPASSTTCTRCSAPWA
jgi:alkylation response protein AidB-like acyl-CoA dehydrogenase